jgi:uncharacterized protein
MTAMGRLEVRVHPRARRDAVRGRRADGTVQVEVTAAPEDGRANRAVCAVLAAALGLRERDVQVVRGASSRTKTIEVPALDDDELARRIGDALDAEDAR